MIGFLIDLVQDTEFILPLAQECQRQKTKYRVFISRQACLNSPSLLSNLKKEKISFNVEPTQSSLRYKLLSWMPWPSLQGITDFLTAVETSASPHRLASSIVQTANQSGIRTFTLQHGFENIGLTYSDQEYPIKNIRIESQHILIWGPSDTLHKDLPLEVRNRCVPVGIAKNYPTVNHSAGHYVKQNIVVGIFENLHWSRYDNDFRSQFISLIESIPKNFPDYKFCLKPHPAGNWINSRFKGALTVENNVVIYNSTHTKQHGLSNNDFINQCDIVITTPSSVAIDGIVCQKPTLVIGYGLNLQNYRPIDIASSNKDIFEFVKDASVDPSIYIERGRAFLAEKIIKQNAVEDIIKMIKRSDFTRGQLRQP